MSTVKEQILRFHSTRYSSETSGMPYSRTEIYFSAMTCFDQAKAGSPVVDYFAESLPNPTGQERDKPTCCLWIEDTACGFLFMLWPHRTCCFVPALCTPHRKDFVLKQQGENTRVQLRASQGALLPFATAIPLGRFALPKNSHTDEQMCCQDSNPRCLALY